MRALVIIGVGLCLASPVLAGDFRSACNTSSLCSGVEPGGGRLIRCLKEHKDKVSTKCKIALGEFFLNQPMRKQGGGGAGRGGGGGGGGGGADGGGEQGPPPGGGGAEEQGR